jgi:glutamate-1-semialdehyde 2,1-aminomutase
MDAALALSTVTEYAAAFPESARLARVAAQTFPDGVTHDGRHLMPFPVYIERAAGSKKWSIEGREIIDYWMGHGSLILGHSHPAIVDAVQKQVALGTHYGACHPLEIEWAERVRNLMPAAERVRFTNSGTEATLMGVRVSRIVTGRTKVLKFAGHFHGWHDLLIPGADPPYVGEAGGPSPFTMPGIPQGVMNDLVIIPPNDPMALDEALATHKPACVILEATGGHWGAVPMRAEFLAAVRDACDRHGSLLILDEVITGFRVAPGGAQEAYGVRPDLISLAKILAGGLPGGCLAGRADVMEALSFTNRYGQKMKHPGTYNANPLSAAAGIAALDLVATREPVERANESGLKLREAFNNLFRAKSVDWVAYGEFSMVTVLPGYTGPRPTSDDFIPYDNDYVRLDRKIDPALTHAFRRSLLLEGVDFFGWRAMLSSEHTEDDIEQTVVAMSGTIDRLRADDLIG